MEETKKCSECGRELPLSSFSKARKKMCKECYAKLMRQIRQLRKGVPMTLEKQLDCDKISIAIWHKKSELSLFHGVSALLYLTSRNIIETTYIGVQYDEATKRTWPLFANNNGITVYPKDILFWCDRTDMIIYTNLSELIKK